MSGYSHKLVAGVITLSILIILIASGPAQAYILGLTISNNSVYKGDRVYFLASFNLENKNPSDVNFLNLRIIGGTTMNCKFNADGSIISGCLGITIKKIGNDSSNNSYGYSYGNPSIDLTYNITLDSSRYVAGSYTTKLGITAGSDIVQKDGPDFSINYKDGALERCSLRGNQGNLTLGNLTFKNNNKINFYIPAKNAEPGQGYLTGQVKRDTFSFNFNIDSVLDSNKDNATVKVIGDYRLNLQDKQSATATIFLDKKKKTVSVISSSFNATNMKITFSQNCLK
jgi:hypothetical protein